MKEYQEKFIWNNFINKLKEDFKEKINQINEMIIDSSDEENFNGNNEL